MERVHADFVDVAVELPVFVALSVDVTLTDDDCDGLPVAVMESEGDALTEPHPDTELLCDTDGDATALKVIVRVFVGVAESVHADFVAVAVADAVMVSVCVDVAVVDDVAVDVFDWVPVAELDDVGVAVFV